MPRLVLDKTLLAIVGRVGTDPSNYKKNRFIWREAIFLPCTESIDPATRIVS